MSWLKLFIVIQVLILVLVAMFHVVLVFMGQDFPLPIYLVCFGAVCLACFFAIVLEKVVDFID